LGEYNPVIHEKMILTSNRTFKYIILKKTKLRCMYTKRMDGDWDIMTVHCQIKSSPRDLNPVTGVTS